VATTDLSAAAREHASEAVDVTRKVVERARTARVSFLAAAVAYFVAVSLLPLAVVVVIAASFLGGTDLALVIIGEVTDLFGPRVDELLYRVLTEEATGMQVTLVGLPVVLWGALRTFRGLDAAFEEVYDADERDSLPEALVDAAVVFTTVTLGAGLMVVIGFVVTATTPIGNILEPLALFVGLVVVFFPMYYLFPNVDPEPTEVLPGTLFTAATWTLFQVGFQSVLADISGASNVGVSSAGAFGAVLLILTWLYGGSLLLLVGATLNAVMAERVAVEVEDDLFPEYG
jgi:membrane protein